MSLHNSTEKCIIYVHEIHTVVVVGRKIFMNNYHWNLSALDYGYVCYESRLCHKKISLRSLTFTSCISYVSVTFNGFFVGICVSLEISRTSVLNKAPCDIKL